MTQSAVAKDWRSFEQLGAGVYPTPIEEMPRLRAALGGGPRLFIKRDDYTGPGFGGNKVRKLEFVLAAARAEGADVVLTIGGIRSNHARVTAALSAKAGLECHLILNGDAAPMPASTYLDELYGATIHHVVRGDQRKPTMERIADELRASGRKPCAIPLGASVPLGALGYMRAAEEIATSGIVFDALFHSTSSGGTQAGLVAGLAGSPTKVIGVSADDTAIDIAARVARIAAGVADLLGRKIDPKIEVDAGFIGAGYGIATPEGEEALDLFARCEGVILDPVYTAKAAAGVIARVRAGEFREGQNVLFLHTGGQLALFSRSA
ncbi:MAG: D-cysteine desulfhydrase family protein [Acidobacteriia bacterium]|nr:D-cysteine desulfhydrase family protein [Terriglobia bacterium]